MVVGKFGAAQISLAELRKEIIVDGDKGGLRGELLTVDELLQSQRPEARGSQSVVCVHGRFDILHSGHVECLTKAKALGDILIVLLYSDDSAVRIDGADELINDIHHRSELLLALESVDVVVVSDEDSVAHTVTELRPNTLIEFINGCEATLSLADSVASAAGQVEFIDVKTINSTHTIMNKVKEIKKKF